MVCGELIKGFSVADRSRREWIIPDGWGKTWLHGAASSPPGEGKSLVSPGAASPQLQRRGKRTTSHLQPAAYLRPDVL